MAIYLKKFETHTQYENYINGSDAILPNVSICTTEGDVHYNPYVEPIETRVVAKFNVTSTSSPTKIGYNRYISGFSAIEIDGVEQPSVISAYTFSTTGEHTVKYMLTNQTTIGDYAFSYCNGLTSIDIPSGVTTIGGSAFYGCSGLTSIDIPSGVTTIGNGVFSYCNGLTNIDIPSGVTTIGNNAFNECKGLTNITVDSDNVNYSSDEGVLFNKAKTTLIRVPISNSRTSYNIPNSVTTIGDYAFSYCNGLTSIDIPSGVTTIGNGAFMECESLTSIDIPNSVTSIGEEVFYYCTGLTNVTIPNSVTSIDYGAFDSCYSLTSITIPSGVTWIGYNVLEHCYSLTSIYVLPSEPPSLYSDAFYDSNNCPIYVPRDSVDAYKAAEGWSDYADRIKAIP